MAGASHLEALAIEKAKSKATGDAIVGASLLGLAVVAAGAGGNPNDKDYNATKMQLELLEQLLQVLQVRQ